MLRSIAYNYPEFQSLPRGIKKMLVVTESFFFGEETRRSSAALRPTLVRRFPVSPLARGGQRQTQVA